MNKQEDFTKPMVLLMASSNRTQRFNEYERTCKELGLPIITCVISANRLYASVDCDWIYVPGRVYVTHTDGYREKVKKLFDKAGVLKSSHNSYGTDAYAWKCPTHSAFQLAQDLLSLYEEMKPS